MCSGRVYTSSRAIIIIRVVFRTNVGIVGLANCRLMTEIEPSDANILSAANVTADVCCIGHLVKTWKLHLGSICTRTTFLRMTSKLEYYGLVFCIIQCLLRCYILQ